LARAYPRRTLLVDFYVQPRRIDGQDGEDTMRSRSVLFLALGTAVATACGSATPLYVAENGLISLNVPLTYSRMGSLSTRTTHPHFIALYRATLAALDLAVPLEMPYRFETKGEMLAGVKNPEALRDGLGRTLSCSRPDAGRFQGRPPGTHCGYCVPCIIRLASMRAAGFDTDGAAFQDITRSRPAPDTPQGTDLRAFEMAIERVRISGRLQLVGHVLETGPLPPSDVRAYAEVYERGLGEVAEFLKAR
jgi:hypothetical protein